MSTFLEYLLYAAAFIAVVLAVEGIGRLLRSSLGEERVISQRLAKSRARAMAQVEDEAQGKERISASLTARFPRLRAALARADARFSALQLVIGATALFVVVLLLLSMAGAPRLIAFAAATAMATGTPYLVLTSMASRRRKRFLDQLPQAVDLIARSLQAGHPVTTAMSAVGQRMSAPLGTEFRLVMEEMTYGLDRDEALANMLQRFPVAELRMFVASMEVTRESGGNLAEVFLKLADAIRAKDHLRRKVHAISAEGRMSFWVVTSLPVFVAAALLLLRPTFFSDVVADPLFWPMMSFAPITLTIGATMIWRMVNLKI
ncbi:type II secretion system F family protein [Phenylobacterium sp. LjRoot225]|uniref:type II secretion system F family protein n=1 Tax=Phenylobacterium sp. LjRoot225 TaxID=3342285 RepID=UPI003ECC4E2B